VAVTRPSSVGLSHRQNTTGSIWCRFSTQLAARSYICSTSDALPEPATAFFSAMVRVAGFISAPSAVTGRRTGGARGFARSKMAMLSSVRTQIHLSLSIEIVVKRMNWGSTPSAGSCGERAASVRGIRVSARMRQPGSAENVNAHS
jgi:hypothetical protein